MGLRFDSLQLQSTPAENETVPVDRVAAASNEREYSEDARALEERIDSPSEAGRPDAGAGEPTETSVKSLRKPPTSGERTKGTQDTVVARSVVATHEAQSVQPSSSRDAFFEEVASLDEEIKKLRSELARKLQQQNAQLKTMLKRFDVS